MAKNGFYATLPSNTLHPSRYNIPGHYWVKLATEFDFTGENWEVALVETDIPIAWYNLPEHPVQDRNIAIWRFKFRPGDVTADNSVSYHITPPASVDENDHIFLTERIPYGHYNSIQFLIDEINKILSLADIVPSHDWDNFPRNSRLTLNPQNLKPSVHIAPGDRIYFSREMCKILRLECGEDVELCSNPDTRDRLQCKVMVFEGGSVETTGPGGWDMLKEDLSRHRDPGGLYRHYYACGVPTFTSHTSNIYIYSNIVDFEVTGNMLTQLLKAVRGKGGFGEDIKMIIPKPQYKKVATDLVKEIEIKLKDDQGKTFEFQFGVVTLVLHFRKVRQY